MGPNGFRVGGVHLPFPPLRLRGIRRARRRDPNLIPLYI